jgi:hypothetical protein
MTAHLMLSNGAIGIGSQVFFFGGGGMITFCLPVQLYEVCLEVTMCQIQRVVFLGY